MDINHQASLIDISKPEISRDKDVLIRITSAGICTADIEIIRGIHPFARPGHIIGHEFGGIVEAVGVAVDNLSPGDKVTIDPVCSCGVCHSCKINKPNVCRNLETMGVHRDGGFCEYVCVDASRVYRFRNQQIDERLLGVAEPYSIGAQNNSRANVGSGDTVLILGAGAIGLCAMQEARRRGARTIITDLYESRLHRARDMGADVTVFSRKHGMHEIIAGITENNGPDVIINTAGYPHSVEDCMQYIAYGGRIVIVGLSTQPSHIAQADIVGKEVSIFGSRLNTRLFPYVVEGFDSGAYNPEQLVSHFFPLAAFADAVSFIQENPEEVSRVVLINS